MMVDMFILAAGRSARMGRPKPLVELQGMSLLERVIRAGLASQVRNVTVVTGAAGRQVEAKATRLGAKVVSNLEFDDGLSTSVKTAVQAASARERPPQAILLAVCDQPGLTAGVLNSLIQAGFPERRSPCTAACRYGGIIGVPALFPQKDWPRLLALTGDQGARPVLAQLADQVRTVHWPPGAVNLNSPADVARIDLSSLEEPACRIMIPST
jgi:molybdenum cofactor cytidylyltransferase